jgi:phosphate starvation-inducible PhoH-like protein
MEKTIELNGVDLALFFGPGDANLKIIEENFSSQIIVRGSEIKIVGDKTEVPFIYELFQEMGVTLDRKGFLDQKDIKTLITVTKSQNGQESRTLDKTIHYGKNGAITARSEGQKDYIHKVRNNDIVFSVGPAGTGKTYLAVAFAVNALENQQVEQIVLCRPAVEAGENLGFLPGDLKEKVDPYLTPLYDALRSMMPSSRLKPLLSDNTIEIIPLAYMRGRTLNNAFMILDEAQNATTTQMKMFLTRLGVNSKTIITGDITQIDLPSKSGSGLIQVIDLLKKVDGIEFCRLGTSDVVRHRLVKDIIKAYDKK